MCQPTGEVFQMLHNFGGKGRGRGLDPLAFALS